MDASWVFMQPGYIFRFIMLSLSTALIISRQQILLTPEFRAQIAGIWDRKLPIPWRCVRMCWMVFASEEHCWPLSKPTWGALINPPTRFGVHSLLFLCSIQNFVTRCPSKIPSPKSKIQDPQNPKSKIPKIQNPPKSKIPKFQNPNFAHKDLLHNVPKIQNPKSPKSRKSKIQNPQKPKSPKSKIQNPHNPKSKSPKIPKIQNPQNPKSKIPKIQNPSFFGRILGILDFGDFGFWIWDSGPKIQNPNSPKSKIQNPQNPKSKIPKIRPKKFGFWILGILDFGFWGFWILGFWGFWILGILDFGFWDFGFWILGILDFGFWDFGFWGFWILGFWGFWILDFGDFGFWDFGEVQGMYH